MAGTAKREKRGNGCHGRDVVSNWLSVECKARKQLPAWLRDALEQARAGCPEYKLPIVVLHETGCRRDEDVVMMRLGDFVDRFGTIHG